MSTSRGIVSSTFGQGQPTNNPAIPHQNSDLNSENTETNEEHISRTEWVPSRIRESSSSLPDLPSSWDEYFLQGKCPYIDTRNVTSKILSPVLSIPLTIMESMRKFGMTPDSIGSKLLIHVIGADMQYEAGPALHSYEEVRSVA